MKFVQVLQKKNMMFVLATVLLVTALIPQNVSAVETEYIEEGFQPIWANQMNITVYMPKTYSASYFSVDAREILENPIYLELLEEKFEHNAMRDLKVYYDSERDLIAVEMGLTWSTDAKAVSFAEWRASQKDLKNTGDYDFHLSQTTDNDTNPIVDVVTDDSATEGDVSRKATDIAGTETERYDNDTAINTNTAITVDFTDYNHSDGDWLELNQFKINSGENATIVVGYANSTGHGIETKTVLTTDQFISVADHYVQLPMPTSSSATYVANMTFDDIQVDNWRLYKWYADFEDQRSDFEFETTITELSLSGFNPFSSISKAAKNAITQFKSSKISQKISQSGRGFSNIKKNALNAASAALGVDVNKIVDHAVNKAKDYVTAPAKLAGELHGTMKEAWEKGELNPQALVRKARESMKSVTLSLGLDAESFGKAASKAVEIGGKIIKGAVSSGTQAVQGLCAEGSSLFDKAKNALGQLPEKAAGLFSKLNPAKLINSIKSNLKWIILIVVVIMVLILAIKLM